MGAGFSSLYHEIHNIDVRYIKVLVYVRMRTYAMVQPAAYFGVIAISAPDSIKRLDFEEVFHVAYIFLHSYNKDI